MLERARLYVNSAWSIGYETGSQVDDSWMRFDVIATIDANGDHCDTVTCDAFGMIDLNAAQCRKLAKWFDGAAFRLDQANKKYAEKKRIKK